MTPRSTIGPIAGVLAVLVLALAPQAQAREAAKFKVLSISGLDSFTHEVVYPSQPYVPTSCAVEMSERITFHSTKRTTAYAFTSKAHGRARVAWSSHARVHPQLHQRRGAGRDDDLALGDLSRDQLRGPGIGRGLSRLLRHGVAGGLRGREDGPGDARASAARRHRGEHLRPGAADARAGRVRRRVLRVRGGPGRRQRGGLPARGLCSRRRPSDSPRPTARNGKSTTTRRTSPPIPEASCKSSPSSSSTRS